MSLIRVTCARCGAAVLLLLTGCAGAHGQLCVYGENGERAYQGAREARFAREADWTYFRIEQAHHGGRVYEPYPASYEFASIVGRVRDGNEAEGDLVLLLAGKVLPLKLKSAAVGTGNELQCEAEWMEGDSRRLIELRISGRAEKDAKALRKKIEAVLKGRQCSERGSK